MNPFAEWIKINGLTKHDVAVAWQVGDPAVFRVCRDGHWPTRDVALRIYQFTGGVVTPNDMLGASPEADKSDQYQLALRAISAARRREKEKAIAKRKKKRRRRTETGRPEQRPE